MKVSKLFLLVMLAVSTCISLFASLAISRLHKIAASNLFAQIKYENLKSSIYRIDAISESIRAQGYIAPLDARHFRSAKQSAADTIEELIGKSDSRAEGLRLRKLNAGYDEAVRYESDLISKNAPASHVSAAKTDAKRAFNAITAEIEASEQEELGIGAKTEIEADIWTFALILFAFTAITFVSWRYGQTRTENERLAIEREVSKMIYDRFDVMARYARGVAFILDSNRRIDYVSAGCETILMLNQSDFTGRKMLELIDEKEIGRFEAAVNRAMEKPGESISAEVSLRRADGEWISTEAAITNMISDSRINGLLVTCRDITERKTFERQLAHQAFHDTLTSLPNRSLFMERLEHALAKSKRKSEQVGVLFVDLDNFKLVNDSLGHEAGDELLVTVANRLRDCVRDSDTVARLAGDEFTILIDDSVEGDRILEIGKRIIAGLQSPVNIDGREVFTSASVGIASSFGDYDSPDDLLRDADTAMYQAKSKGKGDIAVFDRSMNKKAIERMNLENDIRKGIRNDEFLVHYQPIFSMKTGEMIELEALLRWNHPEKGLILPGVFIPIVEENGLIIPLGKFVLEQACKDARAFRSGLSQGDELRVSINLSVRQLLQPNLVELIREQLEINNLKPDNLKIEITESVMMSNTEITIPILQELKNLGIHLAIDDFGTGYSSMAYIRTLPIDSLKIDRSFVQGINENEDDRAIVSAIVSLGKTLDLHITSEGIENEEQLVALKEIGCDDGQGFHLARPAKLEDIEKLPRNISQHPENREKKKAA